MFEALADRFQGILRNLRGQGKISPDNVRESMREVRRALLEADVPVAVAKEFVARRRGAGGRRGGPESLTPGQQVVGIVREELERLLGGSPVTLAGSPFIPTVVLLAGLQGSGKDDVRRQARPVAQGPRQAHAARERRRLPPGRDRPARTRGGPGRRRVLARPRRHAAARDRGGRSRRGAQARFRLLRARHRRPAAQSTTR